MNIATYSTYGKRFNFGKWKFCGEECGYGLFKMDSPRSIAERIVSQVFSEEEISKKIFMYKTHYYRGRNNLQDWVEVYYKDCIFEI